MYAPLKVWRKWHRKINLKQRRYALVSAIAASGVPSLVLARGLCPNNTNNIHQLIFV
jgi:large subunit ribosomal protein L4e